MRPSKTLTSFGLVAVTAAAVTINALPALAEEHSATKPAGNPTALAQAAADRFVAHDAAALFKGPGDAFVRTKTYVGGNGLRYVSYDRTYRGLPVAGGDSVVLTDAKGVVKAAVAAQKATINVPVTAKITSAKALAVAKAQLKRTDDTAAPKLVVDAYGKSPRLAWEAQVAGLNSHRGPSRLHVFVDALTGKVLHTSDDIVEGSGTGFFSGKVSLDTTQSGSSYLMKDSKRPGLKCSPDGGSPYTKSTDVWGNGSSTDLETACVDAMYAAAKEIDMLSAWMGRNSIDGNGNAFPIYVGLADVNAYWYGSYAKFGHNSAGDRQAVPLDVVGHEFGHAIFQNTPGGAGPGIESGLNEGAADIWGTLTEAYADNPNDKPDYLISEGVNFFGGGAIRSMYDPSQYGDPNCYSDQIPGTETHAAAGPLNHWFYLLAEGSSPSDGNPVSPTCDGWSESGLDVQTAGQIFYNAELLKTSTWTYRDVRVATLIAAKNLFPGSCDEFDMVKRAWDSVSVPAQAGEPTCTRPADDFGLYVPEQSGRVVAGSTMTATVQTNFAAGDNQNQVVTLSATGLPAGATASFNPPKVSPAERSTMTITTSSSTPKGTYYVKVNGSGSGAGNARHSTLYKFGVIDSKCGVTNGTDVAIPDLGSASSPITIDGCASKPSTWSKVDVHIAHSYRGDLTLELVAPDGTVYPLKAPAAWDRWSNVNETYTVDLAAKSANGTWQLRAKDGHVLNTGTIDSWTLSL